MYGKKIPVMDAEAAQQVTARLLRLAGNNELRIGRGLGSRLEQPLEAPQQVLACMNP
jgi:hypothetical protein